MTAVAECAVANDVQAHEVARFLGREDLGGLTVEGLELLAGGEADIVDRMRALVDGWLVGRCLIGCMRRMWLGLCLLGCCGVVHHQQC